LIVETLHPTLPQRSGLRGIELAALALVGLALGWAYAPSFVYLRGIWTTDPNYSHGFLVIPIALLILWLRRDSLDRTQLAPNRLGWVLLGLVIVLRAMMYEWNEQWFEDATIPLAVGSLVLAFGGWPLVRWSLPAIIFMGFMFPLPHRFNVLLANPLQHLATIGSCDLLQTLGLPVLAEGNVIIIGANRLEIARACNGLSMLLSFLTLITAAAILVNRPIWERIILLVSAIPVALVVNILRISITGLCFHFYGTDEILGLPHDWAGYMMMPIALVFVLLELRILSWLVIEKIDDEPSATFGPVVSSGPMMSTTYRVTKKEQGSGDPPPQNDAL
jgi:exosortase